MNFHYHRNIYYHRTDRAKDILRNGFRAPEGSYLLLGNSLRGVLLSNYPPEKAEGGKGWQLLEIMLPYKVDITHY